jgi:hypothetical protein
MITFYGGRRRVTYNTASPSRHKRIQLFYPLTPTRGDHAAKLLSSYQYEKFECEREYPSKFTTNEKGVSSQTPQTRHQYKINDAICIILTIWMRGAYIAIFITSLRGRRLAMEGSREF